MSLPMDVGTVDIYAGDSSTFPSYQFMVNNTTPYDFVANGWTTWLAQWRQSPNAATPITLTVDASQAASGIILLSATATDTTNMLTSGYFDVQATNTSGAVRTWFKGKTNYIMDISRV